VEKVPWGTKLVLPIRNDLRVQNQRGSQMSMGEKLKVLKSEVNDWQHFERVI